MEDRSAANVMWTPRHPSSTLSSTQSASAAWSSAGAAASVSKSTAATASIDNGWSGNGSDMVVIYERQDSEVTVKPQERRLKLPSAQQDKMECQGDVTATASNESAERQWQEVMQRHGKRRQHGGNSATLSVSSGDSEDDARRVSSGGPQQEQLVPTTSRRVWSPKQAGGVITAGKKPERSCASESGLDWTRRREAVRSQVHQEQSVTTASKQVWSAERTGNSSAASVVISSDSEGDEIEERRGHDTEKKKGRVKDVEGARHSAQHHAHAAGTENNMNHARSRRHLPSPQRVRHSSQEQAKSPSTPWRHGVRRSNVVDKRRENGSPSPVHRCRNRRETVQVNLDDDSASDDNGYLQSEFRHEAGGNHSEDKLEQPGAQFLEFIKLKSSPKSSTPRDEDGRDKRQERHADESDERRQRQPRPRDDSSGGDDGRSDSHRKRQESSGSRRDRHGDKSACNRRDKSPDDSNGKRTTARRRLLDEDSGSHTPSPARKSQLKMEKYDRTSCVETFLVKFETCAKYNAWDARDKAAHLKTSLTGGAGLLLWEMQDATCEDIAE